MSFDAVLFDLDGTVLDTIELILSSYRHTFEAHGMTPPPDAEILSGLGTPLEAGIGRFVEDESLVAEMVRTYLGHNHASHDSMVRPYPGIPELLDDLSVPTALVTSKRREGTRIGLELANLSNAFDVWVCADDVTHRKPHPEPVRRALELLGGIAPERSLFVGDSTFDLLAGRAAGVRTAGVLWGPFSREALEECAPDHLVESVEALRLLLGLAR